MSFGSPRWIDWQRVADGTRRELATAVMAPELMASPYARLVVRDDSTVRFQSDSTGPATHLALATLQPYFFWNTASRWRSGCQRPLSTHGRQSSKASSQFSLAR
jgi:hypothetical protein